MSLMVVMLGSSVQPVDVSNQAATVPIVTVTQLSNFGSAPVVYSGVRFGADGNLYRRQSRGGWSRIDTWLHKGNADTWYLRRTTNDSLTTDSGSSWLQMNADRDFDVQYSTPKADGFATADVTFEISDEADGNPVFSGPKVYQFLAQVGIEL